MDEETLEKIRIRYPRARVIASAIMACRDLKKQIEKMKNVVPSPKVMEIPESDGKRYPAIISGNRVLEGDDYTAMQLPEYFVARVTTTLDGCTDPEVVAAVNDSTISRLNVHAKIRT